MSLHYTRNFRICGKMQQQLYQMKVHDVDEMTQCTLCLACVLKQSTINDTKMSGANVSVCEFVPKEII